MKKFALIMARCTGGVAMTLGVWAALTIAGTNAGCFPAPFTEDDFVRQMRGSHVVPPTSEGPGYGDAFYELNQDKTELTFVITVMDLFNPISGVHFHRGAIGENGDIVFDLSEFMTVVDGTVAIAGTVSLSEWSIENAADELADRNIYVDIHTVRDPTGELRGQVLLGP